MAAQPDDQNLEQTVAAHGRHWPDSGVWRSKRTYAGLSEYGPATRIVEPQLRRPGKHEESLLAPDRALLAVYA